MFFLRHSYGIDFDLSDFERHIIWIYLEYDFILFGFLIPCTLYTPPSLNNSSVFALCFLVISLWREINCSSAKIMLKGNIIFGIPYISILTLIFNIYKSYLSLTPSKLTILTIQTLQITSVEFAVNFILRLYGKLHSAN